MRTPDHHAFSDECLSFHLSPKVLQLLGRAGAKSDHVRGNHRVLFAPPIPVVPRAGPLAAASLYFEIDKSAHPWSLTMKKALFCLILLPGITAAQQVDINGGEVKVQAGDTYVDVNGAGHQGDTVVRNTATDGGTAAVKGSTPTSGASSAQAGGEVRVETKTVSTRTDSRGSTTHSTVSTQSTTGGGGSYVNGDLDGSHFAGKQLAGAAFTNASLIEADFRKADLQNADFTNADLTRARLQGADLRHATITNTDFSDATLDGAQWVDGRTCAPGSIGSCR